MDRLDPENEIYLLFFWLTDLMSSRRLSSLQNAAVPAKHNSNRSDCAIKPPQAAVPGITRCSDADAVLKMLKAQATNRS
jgi:hypothetical protein